MLKEQIGLTKKHKDPTFHEYLPHTKTREKTRQASKQVEHPNKKTTLSYNYIARSNLKYFEKHSMPLPDPKLKHIEQGTTQEALRNRSNRESHRTLGEIKRTGGEMKGEEKDGTFSESPVREEGSEKEGGREGEKEEDEEEEKRTREAETRGPRQAFP